MSLHDAIANAARQTLSNYLAPELVEQLTEEIVHRVGPEAETALHSFLGFELGRSNTRGAKASANQPKRAMARKGRKPNGDTLDDGHPRPANGSEHTAEPSPAEMS